MSQPVISVEHLVKQYRLGVIGRHSLMSDIRGYWRRRRSRSKPGLLQDPRSKDFDDGRLFRALDNVSLEVFRGETLGVIGRNGAGKSTLLKILSRITTPSSGTVRMKGRVATLLEVGTGFHPELTGRENIFLNGAILGMSHQEVNAKLEEIVAFAEINQFIDTPVKRYSSGMYVRLAFAVAAHLESEILIVDEVLAVGDSHFQKKCLGRMTEIGREGRTVLFVSHNLAAVNRLCSRCLLLEGGRLVSQGPPFEVIEVYTNRGLAGELIDQSFDGPMAEGKRAKVRRIRLENSRGEAISKIGVTESFEIVIEYELCEALRGVTVGIEVQSDQLGLAVVSVSDTELDVALLNPREPGRYRARVRIPDRIINTGTYHIRSGIVQAREIIDVAESAPFQVDDSVGIMGALGLDRKSAICALQLPWSINKFPSPCDSSVLEGDK